MTKTLETREFAYITNAISTHISQLYRDMDTYKKMRKWDEVVDTLVQVRQGRELLHKITYMLV